jgi:hypothetical protein
VSRQRYKGFSPERPLSNIFTCYKLFSHRCKKSLCTHAIWPGRRVPVLTHFTLVLSGKFPSLSPPPFPPPPSPLPPPPFPLPPLFLGGGGGREGEGGGRGGSHRRRRPPEGGGGTKSPPQHFIKVCVCVCVCVCVHCEYNSCDISPWNTVNFHELPQK